MEVRRFRLKKGTLFVITALLLVLVPLVALAIPGSGDFTSLESPSGRNITELYNVIAKICLGIMILVEVLLLVIIVRFRRRSEDEMPRQVHGHLPLEIGWTLAAAAVQVYIGIITIDTMFEVEVMPETEMTVEVIGSQWDWDFRYPDHGNIMSKDLVIPAHTNVKLEVTSQDVIHSIFIPELGVKIDAVPGRFNYWWFRADGPVNQVLASETRQRPESQARVTTRPDFIQRVYGWFEDEQLAREDVVGLERRVKYLAHSRAKDLEGPSAYAKYDAIEYRGMCTELCGKGHYNMYFRAVAMTPSSFQQWLVDQRTSSGEPDGAQIYETKCATCHAADGQGTPGSFPPLVGTKWMQEDMKDAHIEVVLVGSQATTLQGPTEVLGTVYNGVMLPQHELYNDAEIAAVVNHERTSWGNDGGTVTAEDVARVREQLGLPPFPAGGAVPTPPEELSAQGERLYAACVTCHGTEGKGMQGVPDLAGNPLVLGNIPRTVEIMVKGLDTDQWPGVHPPMGADMSNRQLAALLTYMRSSFGNEASAVQPDEVDRIRDEIE